MITAGMKQRNGFTGFGVDSADIAALPCIASRAGPRKVLRIGCSAMLLTHNVIHLMRSVRIALVE